GEGAVWLDSFVVARESITKRLDQFLATILFVAVQTVELFLDFALRSHENTQTQARPQTNGILRFTGERIGHDERKDLVLNIDRTRVKSAQEAKRQATGLNRDDGIFV